VEDLDVPEDAEPEPVGFCTFDELPPEVDEHEVPAAEYTPQVL